MTRTALRALECDEPGCDAPPVTLCAVYHRDKAIGVSFACETHKIVRMAQIVATLNRQPEASVFIPVKPGQIVLHEQVKAALSHSFLSNAWKAMT